MSAPTLKSLARDFRWGHKPLIPRSAESERIHRPRHEVSTDWARRPSMRLVRAGIQAGALKPLMHYKLTPMTSGREVLRELDETPCVIVANHTSHLDTAVLIAALPAEWRRRTAVAAAADYFFDAWWRAVPTALAFGTIPIERRGGAPSRTPGDLLGRGWNLVVFPEGTRSKDGVQGRFRLGAANLALAADVPILPVAITGSYAAMPRGRNWPAPGRPRVSVRFGRPDPRPRGRGRDRIHGQDRLRRDPPAERGVRRLVLLAAHLGPRHRHPPRPWSRRPSPNSDRGGAPGPRRPRFPLLQRTRNAFGGKAPRGRVTIVIID